MQGTISFIVPAGESMLERMSSPELLRLTKELRYPRQDAQKALAMRNNDVDAALLWLKVKGIQPLPPKLTKAEQKQQDILARSLAHKRKADTAGLLGV